MGRLSDRFGIILPVAGGAISLSIGYVAASAAQSLWQFTLAQALFVGVASSVTFGPLLADTSLWFTRRRGMAVAIFASGNYLAGTVWPPIIQHLIEQRGLAPGARRHRPVLRGDHVAAHPGAEETLAPDRADLRELPARHRGRRDRWGCRRARCRPCWSSPV